MRLSLVVVFTLSTCGLIACERRAEPNATGTPVTAETKVTPVTAVTAKTIEVAKPAATAEAAADAGQSCGPKGATYVACGCGCCGEPMMDNVKCVDTAKGETLASIEAADKVRKASKNCAVMGCSLGTVYKCCD